MDIQSCTPSQWYEEESKYLELLKDENYWEKIPLLNVNELHNLKESTLVRFKGMIQDMHGPEIYMEKFEVINNETNQTFQKNGKYLDIASCGDNEAINEDSPTIIRSERHTYVGISIPAVNDWVTKIEEHKYKLDIIKTDSNIPSAKRPVEEMEVDQSNEPTTTKRQCTTSSKPVEPPNSISKEHLLNFPIPDSKGIVCHLKIYGNSDTLKINSTCEFVGFLSMDPAIACQGLDDEMNDPEFQVHNPPPSLIPRLHCVHFKPLSHNNPLVEKEQLTTDRMQVLRKELLIVLTQLLCGDELAAEYLIYHLISEVYLRKDFLALGKFSLNISNLPKFQHLDYVQELYKFIEMMVTKSHYLPLSLENMNELAFIPKKDYTSNRLTSSILQLSPNTHLVVDETKLNPGKLNEAGVQAVRAIAGAIKNQKTAYDFTYYQIDFECDIPFLVLSEGKSMLPSDAHVVLEPDDLHLNTFSEIVDAAKHFLKPDLLNEIRKYLTSARLINYNINDGVEELVQNEFVNLRQKGNVSADDLHNLLVLARLVSISHGQGTLSEECWRRACDLEEKRKARLNKRTV